MWPFGRRQPSAPENEPPLTPARTLLYMVSRYDDLTIPEVVARSSEDPAVIVRNIVQLHEMGFIRVNKPEVLLELRAIADDITARMSDRPTLDKRVALLNRTSRKGSGLREAILTPAP